MNIPLPHTVLFYEFGGTYGLRLVRTGVQANNRSQPGPPEGSPETLFQKVSEPLSATANSYSQGVDDQGAYFFECRWLTPVLVGQFEFVQWTAEAHLRHSRFIALREDKKAKDVHGE